MSIIHNKIDVSHMSMLFSFVFNKIAKHMSIGSKAQQKNNNNSMLLPPKQNKRIGNVTKRVPPEVLVTSFFPPCCSRQAAQGCVGRSNNEGERGGMGE